MKRSPYPVHEFTNPGLLTGSLRTVGVQPRFKSTLVDCPSRFTCFSETATTQNKTQSSRPLTPRAN